MRTIKFATSDAQQLQFATAVRKNVHDYFKAKGISTKANAEMLLQTLSMLALYIAPFILLLTVPVPVWMALILVVIMGVGTAGVGMSVMHDAVHGSYSNKPWVNKLMGSTMYVLGSNVLNWKIQHNILHHTYTNIEGYDHDIESRGVLRFSEHSPLYRIHRYQHVYGFLLYGFMTLLKLFMDFFDMAKYNKAGYTQQLKRKPGLEYIKMTVMKLVYVFVFIGIPILLTPYAWWQVILAFVLMQWVAGLILSVIFQLAHVVEGVDQPLQDATGHIENDWAVHELQTTADFARGNRLLTWYLGGLNFQIEHHLFPHICHIHYPEIAPIVERTAREFGLPYHVQPRFRDAVRSHFRRMKQLGRPSLNTAMAA